jgi:hypothetical protein
MDCNASGRTGSASVDNGGFRLEKTRAKETDEGITEFGLSLRETA